MRIVHVANDSGPRTGGLRTTLDALAAGYRAAGHEPVLVVPGPNDAVLHHGGTVVRTIAAPLVPGTGGRRAMLRPGTLHTVLERLAPDRLEVSDCPPLLGLAGWARREGVPSALIVHEQVQAMIGPRESAPWSARWTLPAVDRFDHVVATTPHTENSLAGHAPGRVPVHRVPPGVDLATFGPHRRSDQHRLAHAADSQELVVVVSRLTADKRVDLAIDTVARLVREGTPARLVVAGDGPQRRRLEQHAAKAGIPHRFLGHVADRDRLATVLATADVLLSPAHDETLGLAVLEALASGTPVVTTSNGPVARIVGTGGSSAPADPRALAHAVRDVLDRPVGRRRAQARARAELYPWSETVRRMLAIHDVAPRGVVSRTSAPGRTPQRGVPSLAR